MIIAFSGLDGTGKTTQAEYLVDFMRSKGVDCGYRHAIKNTFYYFVVHNIIGKASSRARTGLEKGLRRPRRKLFFAFLSAVKKFFLLIDVVYFNLRYGSYKGDGRRNLVCDRYFYDELVQAKHLSLAGKTFLRFYEKLILAPDIVFLAETCPETAFKRKAEGYDMRYFAGKAKLYGDLKKMVKPVKLPDLSEEKVKEKVLSYWDKVRIK